MSSLKVSRHIMAVAIAAAISSAYAAPETKNVSGTLSDWKGWNASNKSPMPYSVALNGVDIFESVTPGFNKLDGYGSTFLTIQVTGTVTYDNQTGEVTALTLTQGAPVTGYYDVNSDSLSDDSYENGGYGGKVTYSGLQWALRTTGNSASGGTPYLEQTAGNAVGCESGSPVCGFTVDSVNLNDHGNGLGQSIFDFQGVSANFQTLPKSNSAKSNYGTIALTWSAVPGASGLSVNLANGALTLAVASRANAGSPNLNAVNKATFSLDVEGVGGDPDFDNDGIVDSQDPDDDNDGVRDLDEVACGTDPFDPSSIPADLDSCAIDTDGDGVPDYRDDFPNDPKESVDTDGDGIGNNADTDDDNDLVSDAEEKLRGSNPLLQDTDGDGINDNGDPFPTKAGKAVTDTTKNSRSKFILPGCYKGVRVNGADLSFLPGVYNLSLGDGLSMFGKYTKSGKQYSLKPNAGSITLLKSDLNAWANTVCGGNAKVTSVTFTSNVFELNKQQTQGTLTVKANVKATVKGKKVQGTYTVSANLPTTNAK